MWQLIGGANSDSSESSSSGNAKYNPVLRFDPDVLNHHSPDTLETLPQYTHRGLLKIVEDYPDMKTEKILKMTIYRHKLAASTQNMIPTAEFYRFHAIIVFKTQNWYYSAEKYLQRVSFQRAKELRGNFVSFFAQ